MRRIQEIINPYREQINELLMSGLINDEEAKELITKQQMEIEEPA